MTASPTDAGMPGDVGLPSEEEIARAMCGDLDPEEVIFLGSYKKRWQSLLSEARCALDLIRPAFEAKEREKAATLGLVQGHAAVIAQLEAKLAQAVEAADEVLKHRVGDLAKRTGYLRDCNASREALEALDYHTSRARSASRGETTTLASGKESP